MFSRVPTLPGETKQVYRVWILGYLRYLQRNDLGDPEPEHVRAFLRRLSSTNRVSEERRQQAAEALIFFHEVILEQEVTDVSSRLEMLAPNERESLLDSLSGSERMLAQIIFSTDLDLAEALRLRVGDVDVKQKQLTVTNEQGCTMGFTDMSAALADDLTMHLQRLRKQHNRDLEAGHGAVDLPGGVHEQFPNAHVAWVWQYVFPSTQRSFDPVYGCDCRYPMQPSDLLAAMELQTDAMRSFENLADNGAPAGAHGDGVMESGRPQLQASSGAATKSKSGTEDNTSKPEGNAPTEWTSIYS